MPEEPQPSTFGPNAWLVDEMYDQYRNDPSSVSESWREFFADYKKGDAAPALTNTTHTTNGAAPPPPAPSAPRPASAPAAAPAPKATPAPAAATPPPPKAAAAAAPAAAGPPAQQPGTAIKGAGAAIVKNMAASLTVPTATSVRPVPAKLLEVNRKIANNHLTRTRGGKLSFTHLIGYAVVQALKEVPSLNNTYVERDGKPFIVRNEHVGLGLAVDVPKSDGSRTLMVPVIKQADTMDFRQFWEAYEELIRKVKTGKIGVDDFSGATVSLTNPGTIGTVSSVPRLMPGQGAIIGVGALDYPVEYSGADPSTLAELGISKVLTLTSTYDHRIIQGAESGLFLQRVHKLLTGEDEFYDRVFASLGVPYEAVDWRRDVNPENSERTRLQKQVHVQTLINMYRVRGHLIADLDPLQAKPPRTHPELDPATYGLTIWDLDREFYADGLAGQDYAPLGDILGVLRDAYCRTIGVEYMHIQEPEQKRWIQEQVEGVKDTLPTNEQLHILTRLNAAEAFERFLNTKYIGAKRFGIEGAESALVICDVVLDEAARAGLAEAVMGMSHRGRLNVLANIVGKSYKEIFRDFEGDLDPSTVQGSGDVKYHKGFSGKFVGMSGQDIPVTLAANPSHLEAVDPVVEGITRARQDELDQGAAFPVLPFLLHGDAAFAGQGVVGETLNLSQLRGYRTGGTIHLVINNQVGFTTNPDEARSSVYPTDVAKMVQAPIFHVNGDDPEACARVARLAFAFRQKFHKDVVIDMVCYRRMGHNEGDDPRLTQPKMYERIDNRRTVRKIYTEALIKRGDISLEDAEAAMEDFSRRLSVALEETRSAASPKFTRVPPPPTERLLPAVNTAVDDRDLLDRIALVSTSAPEGFNLNPKLQKVFEARTKLYAEGQVDWALGEAFAYGTLLAEGHDVRLAGQDSSRGTFGHRNAVLVDTETEEEVVPLNLLARGKQGRFFVYDSLLSEYAALGFEYGYSIAAADALVAWEAQFGDFVNGAQVVIDQFLSAAEDKWGQTSGLVLLLPHGYEGQGPEHSSARIERFLSQCANNNMQVANVTTAAQLFHALRRQVKRTERKPLIVFTTKSGLRATWSRSPVSEISEGRFHEVLDDPATAAAPADVQRVVLASGKVAFDAMKERDKRSAPVAIVRVEQVYPWPEDQIAEVLASYGDVDEVVWLQEEPENMGPWTFVHGRMHELLREEFQLRHVARVASGSPAAGSSHLHELETVDLMERVFQGL
ncbi:MAG TPA: multifunctional oxoglutarate decarboxylase/oxoglutarate dehydrogenase thiamine pyrophosphate-binding subunit/dihydrolipoyllysine-residue succinyltransferase subunit [Acidimicrobiales bacterium]|nr:multifunctional oxoglutarate decarboxylase/oxoglutarate dehydrogenase thiamine pyrophosphate-binding subunit/dihydrolipoyllysine-residue succinyltransferase subunit [Acidimicrobiales bacterium]